MKKYIIVFYTKEPRPPEIFRNDVDEMTLLFDRIVELAKLKAKFCVYEMGECLGDFS